VIGMTSSTHHPAPPTGAAVVFDCDGTLVDSEICWTRAYRRLFTEHGRQFTVTHERALLGVPLDRLGAILARLLGFPAYAERLGTLAYELALDELAGDVPPMPGARELVTELAGQRPLAVASGSPSYLVHQLLGGAGLGDAFDVVLSFDDVARTKPAPDLYLRACAQLAVPPTEAIAVEDSPPGVTAARTAGLYVIGIPSISGTPLDAHTVGTSLIDWPVRAALGLPAT
jgi:HAD superfamily hydrolase (TIGR01509 family)